jgi:two-component system sensor histidine kinase UhpB
LIAEHDAVDVELLHHELKTGGLIYASEVVQNERDYVNALRNFIPDIILADYTFPSFDGPAAFKIKEMMTPDTPFIFVSGTIGEEKSIEHIKNGVTDYVLKDKLFTLTFKVVRALRESTEKRQKKKVEQELILSERYLARAQQMAHMGNWELNFSSNTVRLSDEACRIYGIQLNQNIQSFESWLAFVHPEDADVVLKKIKECGRSLPEFSINHRIINKSGLSRYIYSEGKLEFDSDNKSAGLYGIACDITETILLENKLVQERRTKQSEITAAVLTAQESERANIGNELHENLNQILGVTKLYVELAKTDQVNRAMLLEKSAVFIVTVMTEIRKISKTLGAPGKQMSLYESIKNLLDDLLIVHPIKIKFHNIKLDEATLDEKLQLTIFRIVQEQVNNILKHAKATSATITLNKEDNEVILLISDNGEGTDILKKINGVGIRNIKSRADLHNGIVTIVSKPGKGYELKVALSLLSVD